MQRNESSPFHQWFYSEPHRQKYAADHPVYLGAQDAWAAGVKACAKLCENLPSPKGYNASDASAYEVATMDCSDEILARLAP